MESNRLSLAALLLYGLAVTLGTAMLLLGESPDRAAIPSFLAWLLVNQKQQSG